jgi:hypothetical protein
MHVLDETRRRVADSISSGGGDWRDKNKSEPGSVGKWQFNLAAGLVDPPLPSPLLVFPPVMASDSEPENFF